MNTTKVIVVDENDNIIGYKNRSDRNPDDIIRISSLWVENEKGEVLIAQRSFKKKNSPGKWGPAVAGTLEQGETYESNILKEIQEELGIKLKLEQLKFTGTVFRDSGRKYYAGSFFTILESQTVFDLPVEEVENVKWISWDNLENDMKNNSDNYVIFSDKGVMPHVKEWKKNHESNKRQ